MEELIMDYQYLDAELKKWYKQYVEIACKGDLQYFIFEKKEKATQSEIISVEAHLQNKLPASMKEFFLTYRKYLHLRTNLSQEVCDSLPFELRQIFSAELLLSLEDLIEYNKDYAGWIASCFNDENNTYDKVWHNKLPFIHVPNGDYIALDLLDDSDEKRVVYLSHDDGEGHGYTLGKSFYEFLKSYVSIGCCGSEDWQMLPFIRNQNSGIDPACENAKKYRQIIGMVE